MHAITDTDSSKLVIPYAFLVAQAELKNGDPISVYKYLISQLAIC